MEFEQPSDWKPASQEQPDEHGLCWRKTDIGLLAFKTNEDNTKLWIQSDSDGDGTQVVLDDEGQAIYVHGDVVIPVLQGEPEQHSKQRASQKPELQSRMAFGVGKAASQAALMAENSPDNKMHMGSEPKSFEAKEAPQTCAESAPMQKDAPQACTENVAIQEDAGKLKIKALTEVEEEMAMSSQQTTDYRKSHPCGSPALRRSEPLDDALPKTAKKRMVRGSSVASESSPCGIGELLLLWGKTNATTTLGTPKEAETEQILLRLLQTRVPERLKKATEQEKAFSVAFDEQLASLNAEMERMLSTVTLAEQKLEQCYEEHRKAAELEGSILMSWSLAAVMQNVTKRAKTFLESSRRM